MTRLRAVAFAAVISLALLAQGGLASSGRRSISGLPFNVAASGRKMTGLQMTGRKLSGIPGGTTTNQVPTPPSGGGGGGSPPPASGGTQTFSSPSNMQLNIPDNNINGLVTPLTVSIPAGQFINSISVLLNVQHGFSGNLDINLKAPNGQVINLINRRGANNNNFLNTVISSTATNRLSAGTSPFTGTFLPDAFIGVGPVSVVSNMNNFNALYPQPNGQWFLGIRDNAAPNDGSLINWSITVNYSGTASASVGMEIEPLAGEVKPKA